MSAVALELPVPSLGLSHSIRLAIARATRYVDIRLAPEHEPLFRSAHKAVLFAVTRSGSPARPISSRMVDVTTGSRDLAGLDGAAQAGMILNVLECLGKLPVAALVADVAPRSSPCGCRRPCCSGHRVNPIWREAVDVLSYEAGVRKVSSGSYALRSSILLKIYSGKTTLKAIGDDLSLNSETVSRHHRMLYRWLKGEKAGKHSEAAEGVEPLAWREAESVLRNVGIVG